MKKGFVFIVSLSLMTLSITTIAQSDLQKAKNLATCLEGKFSSLCHHDWLNPTELKKTGVAERRENLLICLSGSYPTLCNKAMLSAKDLEKVIAAEKRENLKICLNGNYKSLCRRNLLTQSELKRVIAAEHEANLKICLMGSYPSPCDRSILSKEQLRSVEAIEKKAVGNGKGQASKKSARIGRSAYSGGGGSACERAYQECVDDIATSLFNFESGEYFNASTTNFESEVEDACSSGQQSCESEDRDEQCDEFKSSCENDCPSSIFSWSKSEYLLLTDANNKCEDACESGEEACN